MSPGQSTIIRKKRRRRRRSTPIFPFVCLALLVGGGAWGIRWLIHRRPILSKAMLPPGYVADIDALKQEYARYFGFGLEDEWVSGGFRQATEAAGKGSPAGAASMLETLVHNSGSEGLNGAVPVVFHDLGVSYTALGDYRRAADAFREALARDPEYAPTRKFLHDAKGIGPGAAEPLTHEVEPNNEPATANLIAIKAPVGGELAGSNDPGDYFKVIAPASPRDLITISLENHSIDFAPIVRVYDGSLRILSWGEKTGRPGESVSLTGGPKPNTSLYISVTSGGANGGLYLLSAKALKAYDKYEPNDDLRTARRIMVGEEIPASIMDSGDSDFFSFQSPRRGTIAIDIRNRSETLIPALTMYDSDRRNLGFAQEVRKPGSNIRYLLDAEKDGIYYIEISSQAGTAGAYSLRLD